MSENLDLALELTFKAAKNIDADKLVRYARDNGWRGASLVGTPEQKDAFAQACQKYTIAFVEPATEELPHTDLLAKILAKRRASQNASYLVSLDPDGHLQKNDEQAIASLSAWLHYFGHALYEGRPSDVKTEAPNFVLQNAHASYNLYLFVTSFEKKVHLQNLPDKIQRIEWIDTRKQLDIPENNEFSLTDDGPEPDTVRVLRIMLHRPEDDIVKTQF
jgi:hypothetical protein